MEEEIFRKFLEEIELEKKNEHPCDRPYKCGKNVIPKVKKALADIDNNRNHSLAIELFERNKDNLENIALFYRGTKVTYKEMFIKSYMYGKSLKELGFKKGDKVPICITNTPEFIYMFLATLFIGAEANIVGSWFDKKYLTEILNKTKSKIMFIDDISYKEIKESIVNSNIDDLVCFSLTDSLRKDNDGNYLYNSIEKKFHNIENHIDEIRTDFNGKVLDYQKFEEIGMHYQGKVIENVGLNDVCSTTYTSGTTEPGKPKGVKQAHRSYITLSRFKESDVSGMPTMKNMSVLAHIPTYTHMELSCAVSDTLYCGCTLCLEPFYEKEFFPYSIVINKPNFVPASTGFWGHLCKLLNFDKSWQKINMPYLMIPTVTGEGCSKGEEKFFNYTSRHHKFGVAKLPFPLAPVTFSIGGGTTESSGIFVTLFKALQEKRLKYLIKKESLGLTPHKFAEIEVIDEFGNPCEVNEPGLLIGISPCEMIGYTNEELNKGTHVTYDNREWLSLGTFSYKDKTGRIKMKGRMGSYLNLKDGQKIPHYVIEDSILLDTKNIMSCSVIEDVNSNLICHIEFQPYKQNSEEVIIKKTLGRLQSQFSEEVTKRLYFRIRDNYESFPLDPSGKRSLSTLKRIGIDEKTLTFEEMIDKYFSEEKGSKRTLKIKE